MIKDDHFNQNKLHHMIFQIESSKVKIESPLSKIEYFPKKFCLLGQLFDFANFRFWTIISHIQTSVDERFDEITRSHSILDEIKYIKQIMKAQLIGYLSRGCQGDHDDYSGKKCWQKHKNKMKVFASI
jgi:hypothetical protein